MQYTRFKKFLHVFIYVYIIKTVSITVTFSSFYLIFRKKNIFSTSSFGRTEVRTVEEINTIQVSGSENNSRTSISSSGAFAFPEPKQTENDFQVLSRMIDAAAISGILEKLGTLKHNNYRH